MPVTMPFGAALAPYTWTKVCRPVVARLREMGFALTAYVDYFGGRPPVAIPGRPATRPRGWQQARELLASLGLKAHERKGEREGTTEIPLLGHVVDTGRGVLRLQPKRVEKIELMAAALLRYAAGHRRSVRLRTLRSFCGHAVSTTLSVSQARYRTQSLFAAMRPLLRAQDLRRPRQRDLRLGHQALADLRWRARLTREALPGWALWPAPEDARMHTEASLTRWGAICNKTVPARGLHAPARRHLRINVLELATVRLGLLSFVGRLREGATTVRIMMDFMVSVHVINNGTFKSEAMMAELRPLEQFCAQHGV